MIDKNDKCEKIMANMHKNFFKKYTKFVHTYLYNLLSGFIRSIGDSKTPLVFLVISSVLNIGLDLLTIMVFRMGVAGAAVATVLSQLISGILCLIYMYYKFDILIVKKDEWKADTHLMRILCSMGVPMGLQYSITAIGSVILQTAVNTLGSAAVAAMTAGSKVSLFFCCPFDALGSTMSTYGGQNVGAKRLDRIGKGLLSCSILGIVYFVLKIFEYGFYYLFLIGSLVSIAGLGVSVYGCYKLWKKNKNPEIFVDSWRKTENAAELLDEKTILLEDEDDRTVLLLEEPSGRLVSKNPEQEEIVLNDDGFVIGSSAQGTDYQLEGIGISRRHIRFYKEDGNVCCEDLDSTNGIKINGVKLNGKKNKKAVLKEGDCIKIGLEEFYFKQD